MSSPITQWRQSINGILLGIAVNEATNTASAESRGKAQASITSATIELMEGLIGEDEDYRKNEFCPYCAGRQYQCNCIDARNALRSQLRQSLKELL